MCYLVSLCLSVLLFKRGLRIAPISPVRELAQVNVDHHYYCYIGGLTILKRCCFFHEACPHLCLLDCTHLLHSVMVLGLASQFFEWLAYLPDRLEALWSRDSVVPNFPLCFLLWENSTVECKDESLSQKYNTNPRSATSSCVIWGTLLNLSECRFPHLQSGLLALSPQASIWAPGHVWHSAWHLIDIQ